MTLRRPTATEWILFTLLTFTVASLVMPPLTSVPTRFGRENGPPRTAPVARSGLDTIDRATAGPVAQQSTGSARVTGTASDREGVPLGRTVIRLHSPAAGDFSTLTGGAGQFAFSDVPAGTYALSAATPGYIKLYYGQRQPFEPLQTLHVKDGHTLANLQFALTPGGVITGHIIDERGRPVGNATVNAFRSTDTPETESNGPLRRLLTDNGASPSMISDSHSVRTDERGRFRIYGLSPADYNVLATTDMVTALLKVPDAPHYLPTYFPGTTRIENSHFVRVSLDHESVADFSIAPTPMVDISGWVTNSVGDRLSNGIVRIVRRSSPELLVPVPGGVDRVREDGSFALKAPSDGVFMVYASTGSPWGKPGVQKDVEVGEVTVQVGSGNVPGLHITTAPGASLVGTIVPDDPSIDMSALRVSSIGLTLSDSVAGVLGSAPVNSDGTFELRNVFGHVLIDVVDGEGHSWIKSVRVNQNDVTDTGIALHKGQRIGNVTVAIGARATQLSGVVTTLSGAKASQSILLLFSMDPMKWTHPLARYIRVTRADADGRYAIAGVPAGDYMLIGLRTIQVDADTQPDALRRMMRWATPVRVPDNQTISLRIVEATLPLKEASGVKRLQESP